MTHSKTASKTASKFPYVWVLILVLLVAGGVYLYFQKEEKDNAMHNMHQSQTHLKKAQHKIDSLMLVLDLMIEREANYRAYLLLKKDELTLKTNAKKKLDLRDRKKLDSLMHVVDKLLIQTK